MGTTSKRARRKRSADEFNTQRTNRELRSPPMGTSSFMLAGWSLADIKAARDEQLRGNFARPALLAKVMRTDDALAVAYENRLAPQRCLPVEMVPANETSRAASIADEAEGSFGQHGVSIHPDTLSDIHGCLVNHGVAFGVVTTTIREDGTRIDFEMKAWPIDFVRWDPTARVFLTRIDPESVARGDQPEVPGLVASGLEVPIIHGDGRWVVFKKHELEPWTQEAAVLPAAMVWARHAYAVRDWAKGSVSHGNSKFVGALPQGVALQNEYGAPTPEAQAMVEALRSLASDDLPVVLKPAGSTIEPITNTSTAWQVFAELVLNAEKAAARIYLGTDGTLGSQGGAPGVDIQALFGVAATRVEGDLRCIERALFSGLIQPWCAVNFGDSSLAPVRRYVMPDADEETRRKGVAERNKAFYDALKVAKEVGTQLTPEFVKALADDYEVRAPSVAVQAPAPAVDPAKTLSVIERKIDALARMPGPPGPIGPAGPAGPQGPAADLTEHERAEHMAKMHAALNADIRELKALGFEPDIETLSKKYGVPAPKRIDQ